MASLKFNWNSILATEKKAVGESLLVKGVLVDASVNTNKWAVDKREMPVLVKQIPGAQLRIDHGKSVRDIVGGFTKAEFDAETNKIFFEAEIDEPDIIRKVIKGRVKFISIGAEADAFCSVCGKKTRPIKLCKCEGSYEVIRNIKFKEGSIISEPAYQSTEFEPVSFVASVEKALGTQINKVGESSIDDTQVESPPKTDENLGSSGDNKEEECRKMPKEKEKEKKTETKTEKEEEVKATELKKVGPDALIVIAEKLEKFITKQEEIIKKVDSIVADLGAVKFPDPKSFERGPPVKGEKPEEEKEKEKKEEPVDYKKLFKEALAEVMKEQKPPEEEEEKEKEKEKKEEVEEEKPKEKVPVKGAKVDTSQDIEASSEVTGEATDDFWKEIVAAAKKFEII